MRIPMLAALMIVAGCSHVPVGTVIRGPDYAVHVVEDAGKKCAEVWAYFTVVPPLGGVGCAIYRNPGWDGDMQLGKLFLPAEHNCAAFATTLAFVVAHEERRCRDHWME